MLSKRQAQVIFQKAYPDRIVQAGIEYKELFIFRAVTADPFEGQMDPFFSVNSSTGEVKEFSLLTDGDTNVITDKFVQEDGV